MALNINDLRAEMPNYENYKDWQRSGTFLGIAVHHSATVNRVTGAPTGNAASFFNYHVNVLGWSHGGYNYVIPGSGQIEYALDEKISAYHAGFRDPDNSEGLEYGQFWNNNYLAICVSGWFSDNRTYRDSNGQTQRIPNQYTSPTDAQMQSLLGLIQHLRQKYNIPVENVRGHRELRGNSTICPGYNVDPAQLRLTLKELDETTPPPPDPQPEVNPGEHVVLLPDSDKYFDAAATYIWHFQPDVSFAIDQATGRWKYVTAVGSGDVISNAQLDRLRNGGAILVQRIPGTPDEVRTIFDDLVAADLRFLDDSQPEPPPPEPEPEMYTVQPGDSLSRIARQFYGQSSLWTIIFEANRDTLDDPSRIRVGQILKIPPKPA